MDDVIATALAQQECALVRDDVRLVVMLDGRVVRQQRDRERTEARHTSDAEARTAFVAAIEGAIAEGFAPMRRDPPRTAATPYVRPPSPPPAPARPPVTRAPRTELEGIAIEGDVVRIETGGIFDAEWDVLASLRDVSHLEVLVLDDAAHAFALVAKHGLPPWATGLTLATFEGIEEFDASELDVGNLKLEGLRRLELRAGKIRFPRLALEGLAHLEVWCQHPDDELVAGIRASSFPHLRAARFWLGELDEAPLDAPALCVGDEVRRGDPALFPPASGIELLSTGEFFPLRSGRFGDS